MILLAFPGDFDLAGMDTLRWLTSVCGGRSWKGRGIGSSVGAGVVANFVATVRRSTRPISLWITVILVLRASSVMMLYCLFLFYVNS